MEVYGCPSVIKMSFGGGGSMSGGLDIRPFPNNWEMKKQLGEEASNKQRWDEHTVINQLDKIKMVIWLL